MVSKFFKRISNIVYQTSHHLILHGLRDSNSRHLVLETSALPTELNPFEVLSNLSNSEIKYRQLTYYSIISVTWPAPTVLPPSLIANLKPTLHAIGDIRSTVIVRLSPGITISTPLGSSMLPVTSVVLT